MSEFERVADQTASQLWFQTENVSARNCLKKRRCRRWRWT